MAKGPNAGSFPIGAALAAAMCMVIRIASAADVPPAGGGPGQGVQAAEPAGPEKKAGQDAQAAAGEAGKKPEVPAVEPLFVRPLTEIEAGRNDSNPVWSPSGMFISFERGVGDRKEIRIALKDGMVFQTVSYLLSGGGTESKFFFPGIVEEVSYNAGITWSPDENCFVFMSNGGEGNYDLYLTDLGGADVTRLTDHKEKDGQAHWSPVGDSIVFVSGRTGKGDLYLIDVKTKALRRLTRGGREYLYPQWSPDGKKIAMTGGSNENHEIYVITDPARPTESLKMLTSWPYDDLRPAWSPDGTKLAFYSNFNAADDPKVWCIIVIAADGSDPREGEGLAAKVAATEVIPDMERGPAWMPDSSRIVYVKDDRVDYNPIYVTDIRTRVSALVKSETRMNHDVSCSREGTIAFRAQVNQWDQIYIMKLKE